jgi:hypothetical protein
MVAGVLNARTEAPLMVKRFGQSFAMAGALVCAGFLVISGSSSFSRTGVQAVGRMIPLWTCQGEDNTSYCSLNAGVPGQGISVIGHCPAMNPDGLPLAEVVVGLAENSPYSLVSQVDARFMKSGFFATVLRIPINTAPGGGELDAACFYNPIKSDSDIMGSFTIDPAAGRK